MIMKRILFVLALVAAAQVAGAQVKVDAAKKALEKAEAEAQNVKKNTKAAVWQKLGEAYVNAYDAPTGGVEVGWPRNLVTERPISEEPAVVGNEQMTKLVYADKFIYINGAGTVALVEVTKPVAENALDKAVEAFVKAYELDPKTSKTVIAALDNISNKFIGEAYNAYTLGDLAAASAGFEKAAEVAAVAPLSKLDTSSVYNAGFTAHIVQDYARADKLFKTCLDAGYYGDTGDIYAKVADVKLNLKDTLAAKTALEEGFTKFPESQGILIGLINFYLANNEDPEKLFTLLDQAKKNEPNNASLFYVEGNIRTQLKQYDEAVKAYEQCAVIDPSYEYGFIGEGIMFYNKAIDVQTQAQEELDDNKYMALVAEFEQNLKACLEPFEKAFNVTKDEGIKASIAEYLKQAYYRFREEDPKYEAGYQKYNDIVESAK